MICPRKILAFSVLLALGFGLATTAKVSPQEPQSPSSPPSQQLPDSSQDSRARIRSRVELVVVPVTVKDSNGGLVADLRQDEFRVFEDGVEQHISVFSAEATPLSAVVLVDNGMKTRTAQHLQQTLVAIAGGFSQSDEVAVGEFDEFYTPVLDFTTDNDRLVTALKQMDLTTTSTFATGAGPQPPTPSVNSERVPGAVANPDTRTRIAKTKSINDAVHAAAELLRARDRDRRKVIVLITDGVNDKNSADTYQGTLKLLLSSDISVYTIGLDSSVILRGTTTASRYAHATGGDVYYAERYSELARFYAQVSEQARHQYTLGYVPEDTDRAQDYHSIEVRIRRPGLKLLTRDGYYRVSRP